MNNISPLVDGLIEAFQCLPGVGPKSARRMVLHLLEKDREAGKILAESLAQTLSNVGQCKECRIFSEQDLCIICNDKKRDSTILCVVETVSDVFAIEESHQYRGKYFILHGHLSPIDNMGPEELGLDQLIKTAKENSYAEIILATKEKGEGEEKRGKERGEEGGEEGEEGETEDTPEGQDPPSESEESDSSKKGQKE